MRIINISGIIIYFIPLIFKYHSKRALIVSINGLLFHTNENNQYLRNYDIFCNLLMGLWTCYYYKDTRKLAMTSIAMFGINSFTLVPLFKEHKYLSDIWHVLGVHLPLSIALEKSLKLCST